MLKNFVREPFFVSPTCGIEIFMHKRGMSRISAESFLSHSTKTFRRGTLLCIKKFWYRKILRIREGRVSRFSVEIVFSQTKETFRKGTLLCCFRNFPAAKKIMEKRGEGGSIKILRPNFFCLTVPKNFVGELFKVSLNWSIEKFYAWEGYVRIFCRKSFVSQCRKKL